MKLENRAAARVLYVRCAEHEYDGGSFTRAGSPELYATCADCRRATRQARYDLLGLASYRSPMPAYKWRYEKPHRATVGPGGRNNYGTGHAPAGRRAGDCVTCWQSMLDEWTRAVAAWQPAEVRAAATRERPAA